MPKSSQKDSKRPNNFEASDDSQKVDDRREPKDTEPKYSIVEFTDGVNIVSTTWLSADGKCCQWPPKNITISYNKLVEFHARPASEWIEAKVVRSFGKYRKFNSVNNYSPSVSFVTVTYFRNRSLSLAGVITLNDEYYIIQ